jgi:prevent-host-death family protein
MAKVTAGEFTREFGRFRALARREAVVVTHHGRDDVVLIAADDYARLRRYEQRAFHVSQLPKEVVAELGQVAITEAANQFDDEYRP